MPARRHASPAVLVAVLAAVPLLLLLASAGPASATTARPKVTFDKPTVPAGAAAAAVTMTIENPRGAERIGSADLVPPPGFSVTGVALPGGASGSSSFAARWVQLRGLAVSANSRLDVTLTLEAPCEREPGASSSWGVTVKRSTSFSGTAIPLSTASALTTGLFGQCTLEWEPEPNDVKVGEVITSARYAAGDPVRVGVRDGAGVLVTPVSGAAAIRFDPVVGGTLSGAAASFGGSGYAAFGALEVSGAGTYGLRAVVTSGRFLGLTSAREVIRADTVVERCEAGAACPTKTLPGGPAKFSVGAAASTLADASFLTLSVDAGLSLTEDDCGGWDGYTDSTALFDETSQERSKIVSLTVDQDAMTAETDNGAPRLQLCFASPKAFTARTIGGAPVPAKKSAARFDWDADGVAANGENDVYTGLLPDCPVTQAQACVTKRKKVGAGQGYIEAFVPPGLGDPAMRG